MLTRIRRRRFEQLFMPRLGAAYRLARALTGNAHDAEDVVQEAYLRAFRSFGSYRGGNEAAWLLTIVRNTGYSWLRMNRPTNTEPIDEEIGHRFHAGAGMENSTFHRNPEEHFVSACDAKLLRVAIAELPPLYREVIVLRELEEFSYREIAGITEIPVGTVMSRLSRARRRLQTILENAPENGES